MIKELLPEAHFFDLEKASDFQRVSDDPELLLNEVKGPIIFDEAQLAPSLYSALRVAVDKSRHLKGQFLISGSSSPELLKHISESLAGRCAIFELEPFELAESFSQEKLRFSEALFSKENILRLTPQFSHSEVLESCLWGGYPEPFLNRQDLRFTKVWQEDYFKTYIERDVRRLYPGLNLETFKRFIKMVTFSTGEILNYSKFASSLDVSQPTVKNYFDILEGTFLWRKIPSYEKTNKKRVVKSAKGYTKDLGLVNHQLRIYTATDLKSHPQFGHIWESFIIEQIIRQLKSKLLSFDYYYYRTNNKSEIDLILEGEFGVIPIEIKAGSTTPKSSLKVLDSFVNEHNCPFGLVINNGESVHSITENVIQLPAICL